MKIKRLLRPHIIIRLISFLSFTVTLAVTALIFLVVFLKAGSGLNCTFIMTSPSGYPLGSEGGIFPAIIGTLCFTFIASSLASFFALIVALYLEYYCTNVYYSNFIRVIIGTFSGIPSIILGLFGYSFLCVRLKLGISILTGGLVLGLMIFPYLEVKFAESLHDINGLYKMEVYSLGVNTYYYIRYIVIPQARKDILSTISLVSGIAMGASAPLLLTGAVFYTKTPRSLCLAIVKYIVRQ